MTATYCCFLSIDYYWLLLFFWYLPRRFTFSVYYLLWWYIAIICYQYHYFYCLLFIVIIIIFLSITFDMINIFAYYHSYRLRIWGGRVLKVGHKWWEVFDTNRFGWQFCGLEFHISFSSNGHAWVYAWCLNVCEQYITLWSMWAAHYLLWFIQFFVEISGQTIATSADLTLNLA